jgi:hypothetical protein
MTPLDAAREAYVRRNPCSLARHVQAGGAACGLVPFPLTLMAAADGRVTTADGESLLDCRREALIPPGTPAAQAGRYFELLTLGILAAAPP